MTEKPWNTAQDCAKNERAEAVLAHQSPALEHSEPDKEVRAMSLWVHIGENRQNFKTERYANGGT